MKKILIILAVLLSITNSGGQTPVGSWSDHLLYNTASDIAKGSGKVYASTGSSIIVYDSEYSELSKLSRINGLTETGISTIGWSEENGLLVIAYSSTNVDLLKNGMISNIPDIFRKYIPGKKEINRIRTNGKFAYLACSFGIVVIDLLKKEILDTWKPGVDSDNPEVLDVSIGDGKIYACTGAGVFSADLMNQGLAYFGNWNLINSLPVPAAKYNTIFYSGGKLYVNQQSPSSGGDLIYRIDETTSLLSFTPGTFNKSFDKAPAGFTVSSTESVRYFSSDGALLKTIADYGWAKPNASLAVADNGDIWIADINSGLVRGINMTDFSALTLPGPGSNNAYNITSGNGRTIICGGGANQEWDNLWRPLDVSVYENNNWMSLGPRSVSDAMRSLTDPFNSSHIFISTWGGGLLEYENHTLLKQYNDTTSPLQTVIPGQPYVRICGMAMDNDRNLWITQSHVQGSIKALKPDGNWIINPLTIEAPMIGDIIISRSGFKWIILPRGNGIFVLDDKNTPEYFPDDRYKKMLIEDSEGRVFSEVYSMVEDLDGNIWVGTNQGPLVYYDPERIFDDDIFAYRIKIPRNDGTGLADYLLGTETITSVAVDGANRKWFGTNSSGAYLVSADGSKRIRNYTEQNSPLYSNSIVSLSVDNKTGDVWFGTSKGIISVRGEATTGETEFSNVYAFPNPVREDFTGNVTITGLIRDSRIRITDISGNLVYDTVSDGGEATWDLTTYNRHRVATGVYLIFCSGSDGSDSFVTKVLVIK